MQEETRVYIYIRQQQQVNAVDACADAATFCRVPIGELARHLIDSEAAIGLDADRLELLGVME